VSATADIAADADLIALQVAVAQAQQPEDELEGRRRSRAAFRRWGERIPPRLSEAADLSLLIDRHAGYWLRSSECLVRSLDPSGLGSRSFHVLDFETLGIEARSLAGFTLPGDSFFRAVRHKMNRSAAEGPVVAVNLKAEAARHTRHGLATQPEQTLRENVRVGLCGTVIHEAAHVVAFEAAGLEIPDGASLSDVRLVMSTPVSQVSRVSNHGADWVRSFAHLVFRGRSMPCSDFWDSVFRFDVAEHYGENAGDFQDALSAELDSTSYDERLVDVLRRPAPTAFTRLIENRSIQQGEKT
jgi:hypothetical protein